MNNLRFILILFLIVLGWCFNSCKNATAPAVKATFHVIPLSDSLVQNRPWNYWAGKYWNWCDSMPPDHHPLFDTAPLETNQSGPVWIIGSAVPLSRGSLRPEKDRIGTIPLGTTLMLGLAGIEYDTLHDRVPYDSLGIACRMLWNLFPTHGTVTFDGVDIPNISLYFHDTTRFILNYPDSNIYSPSLHAGITPACTIGTSLFIDSLSPGSHSIHIVGGTDNGLVQVNVTYQITVK